MSETETERVVDPATGTVFQRVIAIIDELPAIGKTQRNTQQNFMFRGHDDVMNALNPLLAKHGVFVVPDVVERIVSERVTGSNKTMYEVNLHVRFAFYGAEGDSFTASGWGEGTDMGDKATSKAMTMAFKYVIAEVFALATAEVSDADAGTAEETTRGRDGGTMPSSVTREERAAQQPASTGLPQSWKGLLIAFNTDFYEHPWQEWWSEAAAAFYSLRIETTMSFNAVIAAVKGAKGQEGADDFWQRVLRTYQSIPASDLGPDRNDVRKAFAEHFDGAVLFGPHISMSPQEADSYPTYEMFKAGDLRPASEAANESQTEEAAAQEAPAAQAPETGTEAGAGNGSGDPSSAESASASDEPTEAVSS